VTSDDPFHDPPGLLNTLINALSLPCRSKRGLLLFFRTGLSKFLGKEVTAQHPVPAVARDDTRSVGGLCLWLRPQGRSDGRRDALVLKVVVL